MLKCTLEVLILNDLYSFYCQSVRITANPLIISENIADNRN